ncbi:phosphoglycerate kinase, partial [Patescibacteria group bacterium]|nr:phosphoglycerate kinase [Patescibacteria group bacterium]
KDIFDSVIIGGRLALLNFPPHLKGLPGIKTTTLSPNGLDIDENAITLIKNHISKAKTVVLNGPLGRFEDGINTKGTKKVLLALKNSPAFTLLGGGDTINSIKTLGFKYTDFSFVSTGGGAMLNFLTTATHPLLEKVRP